MTCQAYGNVVVCGGTRDEGLRKVIKRCPVCECMTEMVESWQAYYDVASFCCKCGDSWEGGELLPRPFYRSWRRDAVRRHRKLWDRATFGPPPSIRDLYG